MSDKTLICISLIVCITLLNIIKLESIISDYENEVIELKLEINNIKGNMDKMSSELVELKNELLIMEKTFESEIANKKVSEKVEPNRTLLGTFETTAYTDDVNSQGKWVGQTATGRKPQVGVVAVDPKVIPLETKLIIDGYNNNEPVVAGDVGGAIKGNIIDVFLPDKASCRKWGRKQVKVWIVNDEGDKT